MLVAAWAILLSRFSAQETVLFGIASVSASIRPLQLTVDPERTLRSWLREVTTPGKNRCWPCDTHSYPAHRNGDRPYATR